MKSRKASELTTVYAKIHKMLISRGLKPKIHILDYECSQTFLNLLLSVYENYQLVPPHIHRRNASERAIQTFTNHFIAGFSSVHKLFPMHLWCRLIPQGILSLNFLLVSRINPNLYAHAQVHGAFDFNATPIAPQGNKIVIHEKPGLRGSWSLRGIDGWYIVYAPFHCRCFWVYANKTSHSCIADTVKMFPHHCDMYFLYS